MAGIFISYRRSDSAGHAGRLYDRLQSAFPEPQNTVFMDVERIAGGEDFAQVIEDTLSRCDVCLVVIGPKWLTASDQYGRRRLDTPGDWVRMEVSAALTRGVTVIPLLVNAASLPQAVGLPGDLIRLPELNTMEVDHYTFHQDVNRVVDRVRELLATHDAEKLRETPPAGTVRVNPRDGMEYVWIPPGEFRMGRVPDDGLDLEMYDDEKPQHPIRISRGFWLGRAPVTVAAYTRFARVRRLPMPRATKDNPNWRKLDLPIVNLPWAEAREYCAWVGGRLPTEAQWEYAARGDRAGTLYPWGNEIDASKANYDANGDWMGTSPPGTFEPNGFNLFDMVGNVWEWVADWYDGEIYGLRPPHEATADPEVYGNNTDKRVVRGGSWMSIARELRVSNRGFQTPYDGFRDFGLRVLLDQPGEDEVEPGEVMT